MSTQGCSDDSTTGPASRTSKNDTANSSIPLGDAKLAGVATSTTNCPPKQGLPLEHTDQTQPNMASSRISASGGKTVDQTTTTPNNSLSDSPPLKFADQSQSRLMTIPRELRIMIYGYVFDYNIDARKKRINIKDEEADSENKSPYLTPKIRLEKTAPPSKEVILPCRELYLEMRNMQVSAYRHYWTHNRFTLPLDKIAFRRRPGTHDLDDSQLGFGDLYEVDCSVTKMMGNDDFLMLPASEDMRHIRHYSTSWDDLYKFDVVFVPSADELQSISNWSVSS